MTDLTPDARREPPGPLGRRPKPWTRPVEDLPVVEYLGGPVWDEKSYHMSLDACRAAHGGDLAGVLVRPVIERRLPVPDVLGMLYSQWAQEVAISASEIRVASELVQEVEDLRRRIAESAPIVWLPMEARIDPGAAVAAVGPGSRTDRPERL